MKRQKSNVVQRAECPRCGKTVSQAGGLFYCKKDGSFGNMPDPLYDQSDKERREWFGGGTSSRILPLIEEE